MDSQFLNVHEAAEVLRVSPSLVREMARTGRLPAFKAGGWKFNRSAILNLANIPQPRL